MKVSVFILLLLFNIFNAGCSTTTWGGKGGVVKGRITEVVGASLADDDKFIVKYKVSYEDGYGDKITRGQSEKTVSFDLKDFSYKKERDNVDKNEYTTNNYRQYMLYIDYRDLGNPLITIDHGKLKTKDGGYNIYHTNPNIVSGEIDRPNLKSVIVKNKAVLELNDHSCIDQENPVFYYNIENIRHYNDSHIALFYGTKEYCRAYMIPNVIFRDEMFTDYIKKGGVLLSAVVVDIVTAPFQFVGLVLLSLAGGVGGPGR